MRKGDDGRVEKLNGKRTRLVGILRNRVLPPPSALSRTRDVPNLITYILSKGRHVREEDVNNEGKVYIIARKPFTRFDRCKSRATIYKFYLQESMSCGASLTLLIFIFVQDFLYVHTI